MKDYIKFIAAMIIFGSIGIFVRFVPMPSTEIVFVRTLVGSILIFILLLLKKEKLDKLAIKKNLPILFLSGATMGLSWIALFESYKYTTISVATLSYYLAPVLVLIMSPLVLKEKLTINKLIGIGISMLGMVMASGGNTGGIDPKKGLIFGISSGVLYAALIILSKLVKNISGLLFTFFQLFFASLVLFPYILFTTGGRLSLPRGQGLIVLMAICFLHTAFACYLYFSSMKDLPSQTVALYSYIDPLTVLILSVLVLGESISIIQVLGGIFILGGAYFGEFYKKKLKQ